MTSILANSKLDTRKVPHEQTATDDPRRVGIEIEFGGLQLHDAISLVTSVFGGNPEEKRHNAWHVLGSEIGDITIEIDADILQGKAKGSGLDKTDDRLSGILSDFEDKAYRVAGELSSSLVPLEIVTPPLQINDIPKLEKLINALRKAGAEGTTASALNNFGLHINPEAAELDTPYLTKMLRAFFLLEDILWDDASINMTRVLMPFISKFPKRYKRIVIDTDYNPSIGTLIDDYLAANPTRNRDLDMLPMFAHINPDKVSAAVDGTLVKPRPTFHYRLPDCRLDDPDWSIDLEWHRWICVEVLANSDGLMTQLCHAYHEEDQKLSMKHWPARVQELIHA